MKRREFVKVSAGIGAITATAVVEMPSAGAELTFVETDYPVTGTGAVGDPILTTPVQGIPQDSALKSIDEHNESRRGFYDKMNDPVPLGIACPEECCGYELFNTRPMEILTSFPPLVRAECVECGYVTFVLA